MNMWPIPHPDAIPAAWGWFQFLLLLTFPLHLLAMNAMVGGLAVAVVQHFKGGPVRLRLAHRLAVLLPLVIAFAVNFGVAPFLFSQVLYGHFLYASSILMASFWLAVIPLLIVAYYGAYLYDFRFQKLGAVGPWIALGILVLLVIIGYFFVNNMQFMLLPERFADYFARMNGSLLVSDHPAFLPRYLHMMTGALAVGGLFVALAGRYKVERDPDLAVLAQDVGLKTFLWATIANVPIGLWFLLALPPEQMLLFMGRNLPATISFGGSLVLTAGMLFFAWRKKFWLTFWHTVGMIVLMSWLRAWLRAGYLQEVFTLDQLQVVPEYSPMLFFFAVLLFGIGCIVWMLKKTRESLAAGQ